jgi:hypothetical protein
MAEYCRQASSQVCYANQEEGFQDMFMSEDME